MLTTMSLRIGAVVLNVRNADRAASFWTRALNYVPSASDELLLQPAAGPDAGPGLHLDTEDATHLDLYAVEADDVDTEVERLISLGATRSADWELPPGADFMVLRDPEGNLFCVIPA